MFVSAGACSLPGCRAPEESLPLRALSSYLDRQARERGDTSLERHENRAASKTGRTATELPSKLRRPSAPNDICQVSRHLGPRGGSANEARTTFGATIDMLLGAMRLRPL